MTSKEKEALKIAAEALLGSIGLLEKKVETTDNQETQTTEPSLSDLVPSGKLDGLADRITQNTPFTQAEYDEVVAKAEEAIKAGGRLNDTVKMIAEAAKRLIPIIAKL